MTDWKSWKDYLAHDFRRDQTFLSGNASLACILGMVDKGELWRG
jgi:hypothetical protein